MGFLFNFSQFGTTYIGTLHKTTKISNSDSDQVRSVSQWARLLLRQLAGAHALRKNWLSKTKIYSSHPASGRTHECVTHECANVAASCITFSTSEIQHHKTRRVENSFQYELFSWGGGKKVSFQIRRTCVTQIEHLVHLLSSCQTRIRGTDTHISAPFVEAIFSRTSKYEESNCCQVESQIILCSLFVWSTESVAIFKNMT